MRQPPILTLRSSQRNPGGMEVSQCCEETQDASNLSGHCQVTQDAQDTGDATQDAQDAGNADSTSCVSGRNGAVSDAG